MNEITAQIRYVWLRALSLQKPILFLALLLVPPLEQMAQAIPASNQRFDTKADRPVLNRADIRALKNTTADITFAFDPLLVTTTCENPGSVTCVITAASTVPTHFSSCTLDIQFETDVFSPDAVGSGISVVADPALAGNYPVGLTTLSGNKIQIQLGDLQKLSTAGFELSATPQNILSLVFVLHDCNAGTIDFSPADIGLKAYFTDTITTLRDSTWRYQCSTDSLGEPVYCDTTTQVTEHSFVNTAYNTASYSAGISSTPCSPVVYLPVDPANAGTNAKSEPPNSSIFSISGYGFGNKPGTISVTDAGVAPGSKLEALNPSNILSWSEHAIKIRMPSSVYTTDTCFTPGTGSFSITNSAGLTSDHSNSLQITYSITNFHTTSSSVLYRPNLVAANDAGTYIFSCDTSISHHPLAYACVKKAIHEWNCRTGVNWVLAGDQAGLTTKWDSISSIYIAHFNFSNQEQLMRTTNWYNPYCYSTDDSVAFSNEADIGINPAYSGKWDYDTTGNVTGNGPFFYDAILHELGHAIGLDHINDPLSLMYYKQDPDSRPTLESGTDAPHGRSATLAGAGDIIKTSIADPPSVYGCTGLSSLVTKPCNSRQAEIRDPVVRNSPDLSVFPNPVRNGYLTVSYALSTPAYVQLKILDCKGNEISMRTSSGKAAGSYQDRLDVQTLAEGVYMLIVNVNGEIKSVKFIKQ